jgi:hypothetical protein
MEPASTLAQRKREMRAEAARSRSGILMLSMSARAARRQTQIGQKSKSALKAGRAAVGCIARLLWESSPRHVFGRFNEADAALRS